MQAAGTVAAPLLAGFSFTLFVLLLPSLGDRQTTVHTGGQVRVVTESEPFSATPELAAIFVLLAGLLLIASVQAALTVGYHAHRPADFEEWYPQFFREGVAGEKAPEDLAGWSWEEVKPMAVGDKWYGAWPRKHLFEEVVIANRWAAITRWCYHAGILSLLVGLTFLVVPADSDELWRWVLLGITAAGAVAEATWILAFQYSDQLRASLRRDKRQVLTTESVDPPSESV